MQIIPLYMEDHECNGICCLDITVAGSPSPAASEDEEEGAGNAAANHAGNHRSNHGSARKGRQKRGVLPKHATSIMRTWLFQHLVVSNNVDNLQNTHSLLLHSF